MCDKCLPFIFWWRLTLQLLLLCVKAWKPSNQIWLHHQNKKSWKLYTNNRYIMLNQSKFKKFKFDLDILVQSFKFWLKLWCENSNSKKNTLLANHTGSHWVNALWWATTYYHLSNLHRQVDLFSYHNYNNRLRLANQKPITNYIISQQNVWNAEIANLTA